MRPMKVPEAFGRSWVEEPSAKSAELVDSGGVPVRVSAVPPLWVKASVVPVAFVKVMPWRVEMPVFWKLVA